MQENVILKFMKARWGYFILAALVVPLFVGLWWIFSHGRLELSAVNAPDEVTYYLTGDTKGSSQTQKVTTNPATKTLKSGSYKVLAVQGNKSYWAVVSVGHVLSKTTVNPKLATERARTFLGNNPSACTEVIKEVLISYACGDTASGVNVHLPATNQMPSYTKSPSNGFTSQVEGIISTKNGPLYLTRQLESVGLSSAHAAFKLSQAADVVDQSQRPIQLTGLESEKTYVAVPYQDGFVMYDQAFKGVKYFSSPEANPTSIDFAPGKEANIPIRFDADGRSLLATFSNSVGDTDGSTPNPVTELVMRTGDQTKRLKLPGTYFATLLCGKQRVCTIDESGLKLYDTSGKNIKQLFAVADVTIANRFGQDGLLFLQGRDVIYVDTTNGTGHIAYRLGNYQLNSIVSSGKGSLLNLTNTKGRKVALELLDEDMAQPIDKQVDMLLHTTSVSDVSAYGKFIFVSPDLGQLEYIPAKKTYDYPADRKQSVNNAISKHVKEAGIDTSKYIIVNPYAN